MSQADKTAQFLRAHTTAAARTPQRIGQLVIGQDWDCRTDAHLYILGKITGETGSHLTLALAEKDGRWTGACQHPIRLCWVVATEIAERLDRMWPRADAYGHRRPLVGAELRQIIINLMRDRETGTRAQ
jgi:hypothetical protein